MVAELEAPVRVGTSNTAGTLIEIGDILGWSEGDPPSKSFVESVAKEDMIYPVLLRHRGRNAEPQYEVHDGRRRIRAASILGWSAVPAIFEDDDEKRDPRVTALVANFQRSDNLIGQAQDVWSLMDEGKTEQEIADDVKVNVWQIRALRDLRNLKPELLEAISLGVMKKQAARMAARHGDEVQDKLVEIYKETGRVTDKDVREVRSVPRDRAVTEVGDLFDNLPDPDADYSGTGDSDVDDDDIRELSTPVAAEPKPKVKISRQDRLANVQSLAKQARAEILAIKSNARSEDEVDILTSLNKILDLLENPS